MCSAAQERAPQLLLVAGQHSSILTADEEVQWQKQLAATSLLKSSIHKFVPLMTQCATELLDKCAAQRSGVSVPSEASKYTSMIIYRIVMGCQLSYDEISRWKSVHRTLFNGLFAVPSSFPFSTYNQAKHARRRITPVIDQRINHYQRQIEQMSADEIDHLELNGNGACISGDSILHNIMLTALKSGRQISTTALRDTCLSMVVAGTDTSATIITALLYLLARGPSFGPEPQTPFSPFRINNLIWRKLVAEQKAVVEAAGNTEDVSADDVVDSPGKMPFLVACMQEAIRLAPPVVAVRRLLPVDLYVGQSRLPKGTKSALGIVPNKHDDPLRRTLGSRQRQCPFDLHGNNRSELLHDSFDFDPERWIALETAKSLEADLLRRESPQTQVNIASQGSLQSSSGALQADKGNTDDATISNIAQESSAQSRENVKGTYEPQFVEQHLSAAQRLQMHMPFGSGPHACMGRHLAWQEIKCLFSEVVHRYDVEVLTMPKLFERPRAVPEPVPNFRVRFLPKL